MSRVILLGTGSAWSGPARENTYLLIEGVQSKIMIDCAGSPAQRLARAGVNIATVDDVVLTHSHPDHVYGWPVFALNAWMAGRRQPLHVHGLAETVRTARELLRAVGAKRWPNFSPVRYHRVKPNSIDLILANREFTVVSTLTDHFVPTIALRVTSVQTGESIAYSCDTTPRENIVELARGVKYLFHEATTLEQPAEGHSSAVQAGLQAKRAGVRELVLLHLPPDARPPKWRAAARREFAGRIHVAEDFDAFEF